MGGVGTAVPTGSRLAAARSAQDAVRGAARAATGAVRGRPDLVDGLLALLLVALAVPRLGFVGADPRWPPAPLTVALVLASTLPLAGRRRRPVLVLAVVGTATVLHRPLTGTAVPDFLGVLLAVLTVGVYCEPRTALRANGLATALVPTALLTGLDVPRTEEVLRNYVLFGIVWALGTQQRRARLAAVREREVRLAQERDDLARRAAAGERTRIARELHDVVSHGLTVMVVQAEAARRVAPAGGVVRDALESVAATGRQSLGEMRRMLEVIQPAAGDPHPDPAPGIGDLDALVGQLRAAGLAVTVRTGGTGPAPGPAVASSAYRIVQEALTNTLRHAGPGATAEVCLDRRPGEFVVVVTDRAGSPGPAAPGAGRGLAGMRERVAALGGSLAAGPVPGGFRVTARLPAAGPAA